MSREIIDIKDAVWYTLEEKLPKENSTVFIKWKHAKDDAELHHLCRYGKTYQSMTLNRKNMFWKLSTPDNWDAFETDDVLQWAYAYSDEEDPIIPNLEPIGVLYDFNKDNKFEGSADSFYHNALIVDEDGYLVKDPNYNSWFIAVTCKKHSGLFEFKYTIEVNDLINNEFELYSTGYNPRRFGHTDNTIRFEAYRMWSGADKILFRLVDNSTNTTYNSDDALQSSDFDEERFYRITVESTFDWFKVYIVDTETNAKYSLYDGPNKFTDSHYLKVKYNGNVDVDGVYKIRQLKFESNANKFLPFLMFTDYSGFGVDVNTKINVKENGWNSCYTLSEPYGGGYLDITKLTHLIDEIALRKPGTLILGAGAYRGVFKPDDPVLVEMFEKEIGQALDKLEAAIGKENIAVIDVAVYESMYPDSKWAKDYTRRVLLGERGYDDLGVSPYDELKDPNSPVDIIQQRFNGTLPSDDNLHVWGKLNDVGISYLNAKVEQSNALYNNMRTRYVNYVKRWLTEHDLDSNDYQKYLAHYYKNAR
ncbi:hypothetical protein MA9V2_016 [Chryseobacterium phage MA9V-2]|nr:hypothetical protein MA9V2_016 [Chryseobacterium phage MA9V-2]